MNLIICVFAKSTLSWTSLLKLLQPFHQLPLHIVEIEKVKWSKLKEKRTYFATSNGFFVALNWTISYNFGNILISRCSLHQLVQNCWLYLLFYSLYTIFTIVYTTTEKQVATTGSKYYPCIDRKADPTFHYEALSDLRKLWISNWVISLPEAGSNLHLIKLHNKLITYQ